MMKFSGSAVLLLVVLFFQSPNVAAQSDQPASFQIEKLNWTVDDVIENAIPGQVITLTESPRCAYHWLSVDSARRLTHQAIQSGTSGLPLKNLNASMLGANFHDVWRRPGLFVWDNPVSGMGSGGTDFFYGDHLIKIVLKKNLRALALVTTSGHVFKDRSLNVDGYDLLLHVTKTHLSDGKYTAGVREWVILNPNSVEAFTAKPSELKVELEYWKRLISSDDFEFSERQIHSPAFLFGIPKHRRSLMVPNIDRALSEADLLDKFFQRELPRHLDCDT